jgi:hypothetical protein
MAKVARRFATAGAFAFCFAASIAAAQPRIVRGTIEKIEGSTISLKQTKGPDVTVKLLDNAKVFGVKAATLADIKQGDYIGVGAMPQPDGGQKAIRVTIFAESQRGVGEGFRPWDRPGSTMTNGTAGAPVTSVNGQVVMVKYKGGEQKIVIGPDTKNPTICLRKQDRPQSRRSCRHIPSDKGTRRHAASRADQCRHRRHDAVITKYGVGLGPSACISATDLIGMSTPRDGSGAGGNGRSRSRQASAIATKLAAARAPRRSWRNPLPAYLAL